MVRLDKWSQIKRVINDSVIFFYQIEKFFISNVKSVIQNHFGKQKK